MYYLDALRIIQTEIQPNNYFEIGCEYGESLCLAKCQSIAVDPEFKITHQLVNPTRLFKMTSDEFFMQHQVKNILNGPIDLAFIDGMHKAEYALRDFMNIEKNSHPGTIVIIDDVLPQKIEWASREKQTPEWTGDVYKTINILRTYRSDLEISVIDIEFKGMGIITNTNCFSDTLSEKYTAIENEILSSEYDLYSAEEVRNSMNPIDITDFYD